MDIIRKAKKRIAIICSAIMALTMTLTGIVLWKTDVAAETAKPTSTMTLSGEVAKVAYTADELAALNLTDKSWISSSGMITPSTELQTLYAQAFAKSSLRYYTSSYYYSSVRNFEYYKWLEQGERWPIAYSAVNGLSAGNWNGTEYGFKSTGTYTVGAGTSNNVWIVGWTAPADGILTIPATALTINSATNATLSMAWTKGSYMQAKATEGWTEYATSATVAEQSFEVVEGESVYLSLYASGTEGNRKVNITYDPTFNFYEKTEEPEEEGTTTVSVRKEIAKIQSMETMSDDSDVDFYGGVYWMGPYGQRNYASMLGNGNAGFLNYSNVNGYSPATVGNNTAFRSSGTHTVGVLKGGSTDRTWAIGYTAPKAGTVVIPSTTLTVAGTSTALNYEATYNAVLQMGFSKGVSNRSTMAPTDTSLNWQTYEAGMTYTIPEQEFEVEAGEVIYVNLYAAKSSDDIVDAVERYVTFTYDLTFKFVEPVAIDGVSFAKDTTYTMTKNLSSVPLTVETDVYLPSSLSDASIGGVIFGNYGIASCFSFEIKTKGQIRLYYSNENNTISDILFTDTDIRQDKWLHIGVTYDSVAQAWTCYIDGVSVGTITTNALPISPLALNTKFAFGGSRSSGDGGYFRGYIRSLAVYADMRTADEIIGDMTSVDTTDTNLLAYYQTPASAAKADISDLSANGNTLDCNTPYFTKKEAVTDYAYSFALVGDTQFLTAYDANQGTSYMDNLFDYIIENKEAKKIAHVFHMGDIINSPVAHEYVAAKAAISQLDGVIPYSLIRGNHDTTALTNEYFYYDAYTNQFGGFYEAGSMTNSWRTFTVAEEDYLFVTLDYGPTDAVLDWAAGIIQTYPNHKVIISTHGYLNKYGNPSTTSDPYPPPEEDYDYILNGTERTEGNNGQQMWEKLVSQYSNIFLVLCGHVGSDQVLMTKAKGIHGNTVMQMLIDPQDLDQVSATGMVTMLYFSEDGEMITVETYSTVKEAYYLESNQYTIDISDWEAPAKFTEYSLTLDGSIGINFYANISDEIANGENAYVLFTMGNETVKMPIVGAKVTTGDHAGKYRFQFHVAAAEMTKSVTAQIYTGEDVAVGVSVTASVQGYAEYIINNSTDTELVALMKAMLNYGAASQNLFGVDTTTLANANLSETDASLEGGANVTLPDLGGDMLTDVDGDGISAKNVALILESTTTIRVYFVFEEGTDAANYTFKLGDTLLTLQSNTNGYYVDIENVEAANLNKVYTLTVVNGDTTVITVNYSALHYVDTVLTNAAFAENVNLQAAVKALNLYSLAADAYFEN